MPSQKVNFVRPPVVEVVLGVQFDPVGMNPAHLGWFWKDRMREGWPEAKGAPPIPTQKESFGPEPFELPRVQFLLRTDAPVERIQIVNAGGDHMVQVQDTRFVFNWVKKLAEYPRYERVLEGFEDYFARFVDFAHEAGLKEPKPNQWEVTYVNLLPAGELWSAPTDWPALLPGLFLSCPNYGDTVFEGVSGEWRSEIPPRRGRLYVALQRQRTESNDAMFLSLSARGTVTEAFSWEQGFAEGHRVIVDSFSQITSDAARRHWEQH